MSYFLILRKEKYPVTISSVTWAQWGEQLVDNFADDPGIALKAEERPADTHNHGIYIFLVDKHFRITL